ncbi:putative leucine-rich receptor-like protein kinase [Planoprotostelium fungivorum]|uniref:Putative leucine-rich receptor-like protein kinase n=1 Tax=Planoprotostelium fungivorum TaxID=1890364 RepID=A0A2P6NQ30_9EUKA|nr:putative leucine-rich receptor-like protein kinase [Planoprotostelium fungivorum]
MPSESVIRSLREATEMWAVFITSILCSITSVLAQSEGTILNNLRIAGGGSSQTALISQVNHYFFSFPFHLIDGSRALLSIRFNLIYEGLLTNLTSLTITNSVRGPLPVSLGLLTGLKQLTITGNQVDSSVPNLSGLHNLTYINLYSNDFTGDIPSYWCDVAQPNTIVMNQNHFTGNISFVQNCINLNTLNVGSNALSGEMPACLFNSSLTSVDVGYSQMTFPSIPPIFSGPSQLTSLALRDTGLTSLPFWLLQSLTNLRTFYLDGNRLSSLPSNFGSSLPNCVYIDLGINSIPVSYLPMLFGMKSIQIIYMSANNMNGTIEIDQPSNLQVLDLSGNRLSGDLSFLKKMVSLTDLNMNGAFQVPNQEERVLPSFIGSLNQLKSFTLRGNNFTGSIPAALSNLTKLQKLDLSSNSFYGFVPSFLNATVFPSLTSIDLSRNSFTLIDENALSGFPSTCSILDNPLSCFASQPIDSSCELPPHAACPLRLLYNEGTLISSNDAQSILENFNTSDSQITEVVAAVIGSLVRTTKRFTYTSNSTSISLQTYNKNESSSARIENAINGSNYAVSLPWSSVSTKDQVSVALSSILLNPSLSIYRESIVVGVQVYDGNGREVEIGGVTERINITMGFIDAIPSDQRLKETDAVCQWWNEVQKEWSRDGCDLYVDEARLGVCQCSHLTNFSIGVIPADTAAVIPQMGGGMSTQLMIIIICSAAGGSIVILSIIILIVVVRKKRTIKHETTMELIGGEDMRGRVKMERKEREEEGIETWKAVCDGVTAVCVMKAMDARGKAQMTREAAMLQRQHHPMIVMYLGQDSAEGYIVTEWMNVGRLREYVRREALDLFTVLKIGEDVAKGMTYIHEQGLVHTHLTASSVFLSVIDREVTAKIANMAHAVTEGDRAEQRQIGPHTAPEVEREGVYKKASDVYSYGLLLWSMVEQQDVSEKTGHRLATRESSTIMTKSWDTGMKALVLDCTQAEDRPKFFDVAKKLRVRRQTHSANITKDDYTKHKRKDEESEHYGSDL